MTLGILGLFAPGLGTAAATLHIAFDHQEAPAAGQLMALIHGHSHTSGTPDHEHPVFRSVAQASPGTTPSLVPKPSSTTVAALRRPPSPRVLLRRLDSASGTGPPGNRVSLTLRV